MSLGTRASARRRYRRVDRKVKTREYGCDR